MRIDRRRLNGMMVLAFVTAVEAKSTVFAATPTEGFDQLFRETLDDLTLLISGRQLRERETLEFAVTRGLYNRRAPSTIPISSRAIDLIEAFEVSSKNLYEKKYQGAIWPRGASGVTIGIGYDVGYVSKKWLQEDWKAGLADHPDYITILRTACGVHGPDAKSLLAHMGAIRIPYNVAHHQFTNITLPLYVADTVDTLPNSKILSEDSLGALVSLVYNRGASFKNTSDRFLEMRAIHLHMVRKDFHLIPNELRNMKRLWPDLPGLARRRELEARLFEAGL